MRHTIWIAIVVAAGLHWGMVAASAAEPERPVVLPPADAPRQQGPADAAPAPRVAAAPTFEDRVADFLQDYYLSGETKSQEELARLYAPTVEYFDRRRLTRAQVLADKRAYFARWPQRRYVLLRDTLRVAKRPGAVRIYDLAFEYTFDVGSPRRVSRGRGVAELTMDLSTEGGRITREAGRVLARW